MKLYQGLSMLVVAAALQPFVNVPVYAERPEVEVAVEVQEDAWVQELLDDTRTVEGNNPVFIVRGTGVVGHIPEDVPSFGGSNQPTIECRPPLFMRCMQVNENTRQEGEGTVWGQAFYGYDITGALVQIDRVYGYWGSNQTWLAQIPLTQDASGNTCGCARTQGGCFGKGVQVTLADGTERAVEDLSVGDLVLNPVTKQAVRIRQIIQGPEPLPIIELTYGDRSVQVSQQHPIPIRKPNSVKRVSIATPVSRDPFLNSQMVPASDVSVGDVLLDAEGEAHVVTGRRELPVEFNQQVYNLELDADSGALKDHMILSNGIVSGDFQAQLWLSRRQSK